MYSVFSWGYLFLYLSSLLQSGAPAAHPYCKPGNQLSLLLSFPLSTLKLQPSIIFFYLDSGGSSEPALYFLPHLFQVY